MITDIHSTLIHTDNDLAMFGDLLNNLSLNFLFVAEATDTYGPSEKKN